MILELLIVLVAIAFFLMWFGFKFKMRFFSIVGILILLILSIWTIFGKYTGYDTKGIQYTIGANVTTNSAQNTEIRNIYASYDDSTTFWVGILMFLVSFIGLFVIYGYKEA